MASRRPCFVSRHQLVVLAGSAVHAARKVASTSITGTCQVGATWSDCASCSSRGLAKSSLLSLRRLSVFRCLARQPPNRLMSGGRGPPASTTVRALSICSVTEHIRAIASRRCGSLKGPLRQFPRCSSASQPSHAEVDSTVRTYRSARIWVSIAGTCRIASRSRPLSQRCGLGSGRSSVPKRVLSSRCFDRNQLSREDE